jgi:hypothetical protein
MVPTQVEIIMANTIRLVSHALDAALKEEVASWEVEQITGLLGRLKIEMWESAKIPSAARHAFHEAATSVENFLNAIEVEDKDEEENG